MNDYQLLPPKDWDKFEELCADLFALEWGDRDATRYGRRGQRQHGVDIYGRLAGGAYAGVQCKGKRNWPPTELTTKEIDAEVEKATEFRPALAEFTIVTTALDDSTLQDHAREITQRHVEEAKFGVTVIGWGELTRRVTLYPSLIEKHFNFTTISSILDGMSKIPENTAELISSKILYNSREVDLIITSECDKLRKSRFFSEFNAQKFAEDFADKLLHGRFSAGSSELKSVGLAWCARIVSTQDIERAEAINLEASRLGASEEVELADQFILAANGHQSEALSNLADKASPSARTAALVVMTLHEGASEALQWLEDSGISTAQLDSDGKLFVIKNLLQLGRWGKALEIVDTLTEDDFECAPALLHLAASSYLVQSVLPDELKAISISQVPFAAKRFPLGSDVASLESIRIARQYYSRCAIEASELDLSSAANSAEDFALWLELRDPKSFADGIKKLNESMSNSNHALRRLFLAIDFGLDIDFDEVDKQIERHSTLRGGDSVDVSLARLSRALTQDTPGKVAAYIRAHKEQLVANIDEFLIGGIEIEALARDNRIDAAKNLLEELTTCGLPESERGRLEGIISDIQSADRSGSRLRAYEEEPTLENLNALVEALEDKQDWLGLRKYAGEIFEQTHSLNDAIRLARALHEIGDSNELVHLIENYPELLDQSNSLETLGCWALFREGKIAECRANLDRLRLNGNDANVRALESNLCIVSGDWERLAIFIEDEWSFIQERDAGEILRTAQLAQVIGSPRANALVREAVHKAGDDPEILIGAYSLAVNGGWENEDDVSEWFNSAVENSDEDGPVKSVSFDQIIDLQPDWQRRRQETLDKLSDGEMPVFGAAHLLNQTLVGLFILPALANCREEDPRRRTSVFAFGNAQRGSLIEIRTVAMDATAFLTLGFLGLADKAVSAFDKIVVPHSTLSWLFQEKAQVQFHQPSRIRDAMEIHQLLATGALHVFSGSAQASADLSFEVGEELAGLIAEAGGDFGDDARQRLVVRSCPVHRLGSLMKEEADLSQHEKHLCNCAAVVDFLKRKGQLALSEEKHARIYLSGLERGWPNQPEIEDDAVVYLDDLSVAYLQRLGLLRKLRAAGLTAYVSLDTSREADSLVRFEGLATDVEKIIEDVRSSLTSNIRLGKIVLAPHPNLQSDDVAELRLHPTAAAGDAAKLADAIIVDDRALNRHPAFHVNDTIVPAFSTLELLDSLEAADIINLEKKLECRCALWRAGFLLIPVTCEELKHHLSRAPIMRGELVETAELKGIRENLLQIRMNGVLHLPNEASWLGNTLQTVIQVLRSQWNDNVDVEIAAARSTWLIDLFDMRGWLASFSDHIPMTEVPVFYRTQIMLLLVAPTEMPSDSRDAYWHWLEDEILKPIKERDPQLYDDIVRAAGEFILDVVDAGLGDPEDQ